MLASAWWGDAAGTNGVGVLGRNSAGQGVRGEGEIGVFGTSSSTGFAAVAGQHTGDGFGVVGDGTEAGVLGRNVLGDGVRGEGFRGVVGICSTTGAGASSGVAADEDAVGVLGRSSSGPGVVGIGTSYGGEFEGGTAQLWLVPGTSAGRPTTGVHRVGEIFMDSAATLWVCLGAGSPGTWVKVLTAA
jgi:hypothetical protein